MGASAHAFLEMRQIEAENESYESSREVFKVCYVGNVSTFTIGYFYCYDAAKTAQKAFREMPKYRNYPIVIKSY